MKFLNYLGLFSLLFLALTSCKKDEDNNNDNQDATNQMLVIENGAQTMLMDGSLTYTAILLDTEGNRTAASNVSWSSTNTDVATIASNGSVTVAAAGVTTIQASVTIGGSTLTSSAPLAVQTPALFAVAPAAVLVDTDFPNIQMETVYFGTSSPSYSYQSSDNTVATVSASGELNFIGAGSCIITVTASGIDGNPVVEVPVTVLAPPVIELPVQRVVVSPASQVILKTETAQYTAKAYDMDGNEKTVTFNWTVADPSIASIDASGNITPLTIGSTKVYAMAQGVVGEAQLEISPNKVITLDPLTASVAAGNTQQYSATKYDVVRSNGELVLTNPQATSNVNWEIPTFGFPIFDVATIDNNGLATVKSSANPGMSTFVLATDANDSEVFPGVSMLSVAIASSCNCGTADANAAGLNLTSSSNVTVGFGQTAQISAEVVDAAGAPLSNATITYCSDNIQVADVDASGEISGTSFTGGTANITVCHGNFSQTVTVTVQ
ncbi:Ig-like domain-containing protein [Saprospira sp. CCB-QB6]|uniref:Ig-like domain-containing protein n=1 Tax=Saprospira sp. CCB-QB6 TaxID=3023936 RepID=UPI00234B85B5|nr:Ig-like domain-containing protein [Saprospira sp. CCB-QB6]WCL82258.1 Ig-like domain-containing protein [Saprospira sp. CCB-QB6]